MGGHLTYKVQSHWEVVDDDDYATVYCEDRVSHYLKFKDGGYDVKVMCLCPGGFGRRGNFSELGSR